MLDNIENIVAVVGCQRSGTTLTGQILGAHPKCMLIDEKDGLYKWFDSYKTRSSSITEFGQMLSRADEKYNENEKRTIRLSKEEVKKNGLALSQQVTTLILKAPNLTFSFRALAQCSHPVQVVYPIRDARAVVSSMGKLSHIPFVENQIRWLTKNRVLADRFESELAQLNSADIDNISKRAIVWKIKSGLLNDFNKAGLPVYSFNYEDLIGKSDTVVKKMAKFLNLDNHESMLAHENVYQGYGPGGTKRYRPIDEQSLSGWKETLSPASVSAIIQAASPLFASLGYEK